MSPQGRFSRNVFSYGFRNVQSVGGHQLHHERNNFHRLRKKLKARNHIQWKDAHLSSCNHAISELLKTKQVWKNKFTLLEWMMTSTATQQRSTFTSTYYNYIWWWSKCNTLRTSVAFLIQLKVMCTHCICFESSIGLKPAIHLSRDIQLLGA